MLGNVEHERDMKRIIDAEITLYLNHNVKPDEPIKVLKSSQKVFPHPSILARNYVSMLASSVLVEQMFSSCELLLNLKQCSIDPCRASVVPFDNDNCTVVVCGNQNFIILKTEPNLICETIFYSYRGVV